MVKLTIDIPDAIADDVIKYLTENNVIIKYEDKKTLDDLTVEDYRRNLADRVKRMRARRY
ncbi:hypothetical protein [Mucilaginibacter myungsuensis]|uniref:Uncharacterized protein n=1 Tax=Mucilaginibacter myungsuensis TaxID=649104 RepID=A0A929KWP1_9SPHI|nr:hypothetical protein [Mucilaginibacter myungsuensis]MBE9661840.1 hypothetical protein [Mucilaginibacter myungsuensis]MDN3599726.1 hypothetical protein [Mucilaginibacter myungsuensis]